MKEMRRKKQSLSEEQVLAVLKRNSYGILSLCGEDGMPYGVPLNYVYEDGSFYFHCAKDGYKTDLIDANGSASFCIVDKDTVTPETFSTEYISVMAFGKVKRIFDEEEKRRTLWLLTDTLGDPDYRKKEKEIDGAFSRVEMLHFQIERLSGKAGLFLMKALDACFPELK